MMRHTWLEGLQHTVASGGRRLPAALTRRWCGALGAGLGQLTCGPVNNASQI
jgi:hypothetical protein